MLAAAATRTMPCCSSPSADVPRNRVMLLAPMLSLRFLSGSWILCQAR